MENILLYLASSSYRTGRTIFHVFMQRKICNSVSDVVLSCLPFLLCQDNAKVIAWIKFTHFLRKLQFFFCRFCIIFKTIWIKIYMRIVHKNARCNIYFMNILLHYKKSFSFKVLLWRRRYCLCYYLDIWVWKKDEDICKQIG